VLLGLASLIARYHGGDQVIHHQLRWLAAAAPSSSSASPGSVVEQAVRSDIDRIISRGIGWAGMTVALAGIYVAGLRILQAGRRLTPARRCRSLGS
jgi:hypothetical protein